jgi:uncharacterized protein
LQTLGQIDASIRIAYVVFLGTIGSLMAYESTRSLLRKSDQVTDNHHTRQKMSTWFHSHKLPWMVYFPRSDLTMSAILPFTIGMVAGILVSIMGIGGGFIVVPAMFYILGMPSVLVIGTSLLQMMCVASLATWLHAVHTHSVDILLAMMLIIGGVVGTQIGIRLHAKLPATLMRLLLAIIVLLVAGQLAVALFTRPESLYSIEPAL